MPASDLRRELVRSSLCLLSRLLLVRRRRRGGTGTRRVRHPMAQPKGEGAGRHWAGRALADLPSACDRPRAARSFFKSVRWHRSFIVTVLVLAVLAGVGLNALVRRSSSRRVLRMSGILFGASAVALLLLWLFGRGGLTAAEDRVRAQSFLWPAIGCAVGRLVVGPLSEPEHTDTGTGMERDCIRQPRENRGRGPTGL